MRVLHRNKTGLYYALYQGKTLVTNSAGQKTGEYITTYSTPVYASANISAVTGPTVAYPFGNDVEYDRVLLFDDVSLPIDENTKFWIDVAPYTANSNAATTDALPHDYSVRRVARSMNVLSVAVKRVSVS